MYGSIHQGYHESGGDCCRKRVHGHGTNRRGSHCSAHAKKSFRHLPHSSTWSLTTSYSLQLVQASYRTAVDTDKMRMVVFFTCMSVCGFETPDVISWPGSPSQASLGQVIQITDDRGFVDAIGR